MNDIKNYLDYSTETGFFTWKKIRSYQSKIGGVAGSTNSDGYILIGYKGKRYYAHRLAWFFCFGSIPVEKIDHINEDKSDNRIENLRLATSVENSQNTSPVNSRNTSGFRGVCWHKRLNKWMAQIQVNKKHQHIGYYETASEASEAHFLAKTNLHQFWANKQTQQN